MVNGHHLLVIYAPSLETILCLVEISQEFRRLPFTGYCQLTGKVYISDMSILSCTPCPDKMCALCRVNRFEFLIMNIPGALDEFLEVMVMSLEVIQQVVSLRAAWLAENMSTCKTVIKTICTGGWGGFLPGLPIAHIR